MTPLPIAFVPRAEPRVARAALAAFGARRRLVERLLEDDDEVLARRKGAIAPRWILVLGATEDLPWVDEIAYFGPDPGCPSLLLPTALDPDVPLPLLERAVRAKGKAEGTDAALWLLSPDPPLLVPASTALSIRREALVRALSGEAAPR